MIFSRIFHRFRIISPIHPWLPVQRVDTVSAVSKPSLCASSCYFKLRDFLESVNRRKNLPLRRKIQLIRQSAPILLYFRHPRNIKTPAPPF